MTRQQWPLGGMYRGFFTSRDDNRPVSVRERDFARMRELYKARQKEQKNDSL